MLDDRALAWEVLFPASSTFVSLDLPPGLAALLQSRKAEGPERVLVASEFTDRELVAMKGFEGLVAISPSLTDDALRQAGFAFIERFAALPSLENLKWLVPVQNGAVAAGSLGFYTPYRRKARVQRTALQILLRLGFGRLRATQIVVARRADPALVRQLKVAHPARPIHIAISAGTPGPARKPTVSALDRRGRPLAFAKVATTEIATALVSNEAAMLRHIEGDARLRGKAPRLLYDGVLDGRLATIQSPVEGVSGPLEMNSIHERLLAALASGGARPVSESGYVTSMIERLAGASGDFNGVGDVVHRALSDLADVSLPRTVMHGDFTPWNLRLQGADAFAFDWEYGHADALPALDELHHVWQTGLLLHGWDAGQALQELHRRIAGRFGLGSNQTGAIVAIYLAGSLLQRLETGAGEDDDLVRKYREALRLRAAPGAVSREAVAV